MINSEDVFDAVRRGYNNLEESTPEEICAYFSDLEQAELVGHISNVKGILFEQEVADALNEQGLSASLFEITNHPDSDLMILDGDDVIGEFQLKATNSTSYISSTLEDNPDIPIITTHEVADDFDNSSMIIDSGINNEALTTAVSNVLSDNSDALAELGNDVASDALSDAVSDSIFDGVSPIPLSPLGWALALFGLF